MKGGEGFPSPASLLFPFVYSVITGNCLVFAASTTQVRFHFLDLQNIYLHTSEGNFKIVVKFSKILPSRSYFEVNRGLQIKSTLLNQ